METREMYLRRNIDRIRQEIADGVSVENKERLELERVGYEEELRVLLAEEQRAAEQEEKVAAIVLPYDFDAIFDDPRANDMITELIQQFQRKVYTLHNEEMRAASDRELQLQRQNGELQRNIEDERQQAIADADAFVRLEIHVAQLQLEKQDAESKRDATVRELEATKEEISQLKGQLANTPAPKVAIDVSGTDKLAQLVKESNEAKALRGLARWAEMLPEIVAAPVLPSLGEDSAEVAEIPSAIPSVGESFRTDEISSGLGELEGGTDQGVQGEQVTLETLKAEVDLIKLHLGLVA